jgi:hypothetical protein
MSGGENTIAGCYGYRYSTMAIGNGTTSFTISGKDLRSEITTSSICSIITNSFYNSYGAPTTVEYRNGDTILTFNGTDFDITTPDLTKDPYKKTISIDGKPELGDIDIGYDATALGVSAQAFGMASLATGRDTKAMSAYSYVEGRDTLAMYAAHAEGRNT